MAKKKKQLNSDALALLFLTSSLLILFSLWSFSWGEPHENWLGYFGYIIATCAQYLFGIGSFCIPVYFIFLGVRYLMNKRASNNIYDHIYFLIFLSSLSILLSVFAESYPMKARLWETKILSESIEIPVPYPHIVTRYYLGGVLFYHLFIDIPVVNLAHILTPLGTTLVFFSLALVSFLLLTKVRLVANVLWLINFCKKIASLKAKIPFEKKEPVIKKIVSPKIEPKPIVALAPQPKLPKEPVVHLPVVHTKGDYQLPSPQLLNNPNQKVDIPTLKKDMKAQAGVLEETLKSFGIDATVGEINSGPTITSFEVHPSIGVKVQKIKALENDIALNMQAKSIRIVAPIPGKAAVGVEVPALHPQEVSFKEMLLHYQQKGRKVQIPILLGKGINGEWVFSDLTRMPHCLIAGATGSGKSVCINTIVMSILMNAHPEEIKLLMVDPKKVELTQYSQLPHMIAPVITEPHGAYAALQWLVKEMQVRYDILKQLGLRNITAFNQRKKNPELEAALQIPIPEQMPFIIAIVDEFADLMMVSSADLETPIARIAQMARAVGIHLILATQRPSREVITGIIKANIPTRISFKVASRINSQIILDDTGAESLLGNGDLLFLPPGTAQLVRAQGAYISDEEINKVIDTISKQSPTNYLISSFDSYRAVETNDDKGKGKDSLYDQALSIVVASKSASTTFLQRKLKIGYARAASLMDELEANGIIGPQDGAKPRRVIRSGGMNMEPALFEDEDK